MHAGSVVSSEIAVISRCTVAVEECALAIVVLIGVIRARAIILCPNLVSAETVYTVWSI